MTRKEIRLIQVGEPHRRLMSLLRGEVDAASLLGPWADIAETMGLRRILQTKRKNPTTIVARRTTDPGLLRTFFRVVNKTIHKIDESPSRFKDSYLKRVKEIIVEMPEVSRLGPRLERKVRVPLWRPWVRYTPADFGRTYNWLASHDLAPRGHSSGGIVARYRSPVLCRVAETSWHGADDREEIKLEGAA